MAAQHPLTAQSKGNTTMHDPTTTPPVEDAPTRPEFDPAAELAEIRTRIERLERAAALPGSRGVVRQLVAAGVISLG